MSGRRPARQATSPSADGLDRRAQLTPVRDLPRKAKLFLGAFCLAVGALAVRFTIEILAMHTLAPAMLLLIANYVGFAVLLIAVLTVTRAVFSLRAVPFLLGRGIRRRWMGR
jgi:hypothetical protein